jgi:hypothetical protein
MTATLHATATRPTQPTGTLEKIARALAFEAFACTSGADMSSWLDVGPREWKNFSAYWGGLTQDRYMGDGGCYRMRRYGAFEKGPRTALRLLPHGPYEQPLYINPLNGGAPRLFDPLEPDFATHRVLTHILRGLTQVVDAVEEGTMHWTIQLHPYRIHAQADAPGLPTPEGLHRDGVDYIVSLMVNRHNVQGGRTVITDELAHPLATHTLTDPMDMVICNDHLTLHAVTPITAIDSKKVACRDVLVIAFTKQ